MFFLQNKFRHTSVNEFSELSIYLLHTVFTIYLATRYFVFSLLLKLLIFSFRRRERSFYAFMFKKKSSKISNNNKFDNVIDLKFSIFFVFVSLSLHSGVYVTIYWPRTVYLRACLKTYFTLLWSPKMFFFVYLCCEFIFFSVSMPLFFIISFHFWMNEFKFHWPASRTSSFFFWESSSW